MKKIISKWNNMSLIIRIIIGLAPFGIMGLVFEAISTNGLSIFASYGHLLLVLVGCMLFTTLVTNPLLVFILLRKNPYPLILLV